MILTSLLAVLLSVPSSVLTVPIFSVPQTEAATLSKSELIDIATDIARAHHLNVDHFLKMAREWQNDHAYWWTCWRIISSASAYTAAQ